MTELMLFPLNSVVLPQGKMSLRIFEPRYQRLVKVCCSENIEFGICLASGGSASHRISLSSFGTMVKIIDFEHLPDGLLGITVVGTQKFTIKRVWTEFDGLRKAKVTLLNNWPEVKLDKRDRFLGIQLAKVHEQFSALNESYPESCYEDASWVTQRWLELLPLSSFQFDLLTSPDCCELAVNFLRGEVVPMVDFGRVVN